MNNNVIHNKDIFQGKDAWPSSVQVMLKCIQLHSHFKCNINQKQFTFIFRVCNRQFQQQNNTAAAVKPCMLTQTPESILNGCETPCRMKSAFIFFASQWELKSCSILLTTNCTCGMFQHVQKTHSIDWRRAGPGAKFGRGLDQRTSLLLGNRAD